jgi:polyribonucleotide nucleotidyltransferase
MDFKVAGTAKGVTAIQMDIKIEGVDEAIMRTALAQAYEGRMHILGEMAKSITAPRADQSRYAPRIITMKVKVDKIREVIGSGGKVIRGIIESTGAKIDIDDSGTIHIASNNEEAAKKAIKMIEAIVEEVEIGKVYTGKVRKIMDFGAFVEVTPGNDGLLHVSEIAHERVKNVADYLKEGDIIDVKVLDVDRQGKMRLSRKVLLDAPTTEKH